MSKASVSSTEEEQQLEIKALNSDQLASAFIAGAKQLEKEKDRINELNVFPVPDGDTGTNMTMTVMSAAREVAALGKSPELVVLGKAMSSGSLRGARGNSGVILSQLLRGFYKAIKTESSITVPVLAQAFDRAADTAYKAVMKPKEGTILTVARRTADKALAVSGETDDILSFSRSCLEEAEAVLAATPDMLPVLKEAGVVDSGGAGLVEILKGALDYLEGKDVDLSIASPEEEKKEEEKQSRFSYHLSFTLTYTHPGAKKREPDYLTFLNTIGDNVKTEVSEHGVSNELDTNAPGEIITRALTLGFITDITLVNQKDKAEDVTEAPSEPASPAEAPSETPAERKPIGFVTVAAGDGMAEIFRNIGADQVISGGQTMNPSTDDILHAVDLVNADTVFILPNNKNIILAANQAVTLSKDKKLVVIPTKTIPQGVTALINYIPDKSAEENEAHMTEEIGNVKTGEVTYAVRDTSIDGTEIHKGDLMGLGDKGLLAVSPDMDTLMQEMLSKMVTGDDSLVTLYQGADVQDADADRIVDMIRSMYPDLEVELEKSGQPVYYFVFSVE